MFPFLDQKLTLEIAKIIREDYLQQNAFTSWDFTCPLDKSIGMMRCIVMFYDLARHAIESTRASDVRLLLVVGCWLLYDASSRVLFLLLLLSCVFGF